MATDGFLRDSLNIELHPDKTRIVNIAEWTTMHGFSVFYYYRLLKRSNARHILKRLEKFRRLCNNGSMKSEDVIKSFEDWSAYVEFANTYNIRNKLTHEFRDLLSVNRVVQIPLETL